MTLTHGSPVWFVVMTADPATSGVRHGTVYGDPVILRGEMIVSVCECPQPDGKPAPVHHLTAADVFADEGSACGWAFRRFTAMIDELDKEARRWQDGRKRLIDQAAVFQEKP